MNLSKDGMDKIYNHKKVEEKWYKFWEEKGYFKPEVNPDGKPYCIILPPPNANGNLHFGHALYAVEDILIRYHRMKGEAALWVPGADHAGFETQYVFEKRLQKEGKSRTDFDRETFYKMIWDFSQEYRPVMENQLRKLGFSLDWTRKKFTLDKEIMEIVYKTFKRMYDNGLIYRGDRLVNYCTRCGTSFSDLEVNHKEQKDPLYYIKYGPLVLATVRPETKFGDTAVAVHPEDKRYQKYVGQEIEFETLLGKRKMKVISDAAVDPKFGTGIIKVTPAHDENDFEIGKRHNLEIIRVIDFDGRLNEKAGRYKGLYVKQGRKIVAEDLQKMGLIEKVDQNYIHSIETCYKCSTTIEPMLMPQWFVKMKPLAKLAIEAVKEGKIKIFPKSFEKIYFQFLENIRDWNISRQIVWGIRIPAWRCSQCHPDPERSEGEGSRDSSSLDQLGTQNDNKETWIVTDGKKPEKCESCGSVSLEQDRDTFDTWFSSGQWPFATLMSSSSSKFNPSASLRTRVQSSKSDFERFYPTSVMETGYEILRWWVARMAMVGLYVTHDVPFKHVLLHGMVRDPYGQKMSKSKGNVVNPLELIDKYGADAVRFALIYGNATGNDQSLSYPKLDAARKFTNKLWNMARFIDMNRNQKSKIKNQNYEKGIDELKKITKNDIDKDMIGKTQKLIKYITKDLENYNFNFAAEKLYDFAWHEFADKYIEDVKDRIDSNSYFILHTLYFILLRLLHPFMPFVTEEIYHKLGNKDSVMIQKWPQI